jgi:hypothetical protein
MQSSLQRKSTKSLLTKALLTIVVENLTEMDHNQQIAEVGQEHYL